MDEAWRDLEREWEANPADPELGARLIAALRRAGQPVPGDLLRARVHSSVAVAAPPPHVSFGWEDLEGLVSTSPKGEPASVPPSRRWWAAAQPSQEEWPATLGFLEELAPPGLHLDATNLPLRVVDVGRLAFLEELELTLPDSQALEYEAPGRNEGKGEGEGASLKFLLPLTNLTRLSVFDLATGWLPSSFLGTSMFGGHTDLSKSWPSLVRLRLDHHAPSHVVGTDTSSNSGRPCARSLATLPELERLELCGWIWGAADFRALAPGPALRSLRFEHGSLSGPDLSFAGLPPLDSLEIVENFLSLEELELLEEAPATRRLEVWVSVGSYEDPVRTAQAFLRLRKLSLSALHLRLHHEISSEELKVLGSLPLESLTVQGLDRAGQVELENALPGCRVSSA